MKTLAKLAALFAALALTLCFVACENADDSGGGSGSGTIEQGGAYSDTVTLLLSDAEKLSTTGVAQLTAGMDVRTWFTDTTVARAVTDGLLSFTAKIKTATVTALVIEITATAASKDCTVTLSITIPATYTASGTAVTKNNVKTVTIGKTSSSSGSGSGGTTASAYYFPEELKDVDIAAWYTGTDSGTGGTYALFFWQDNLNYMWWVQTYRKGTTMERKLKGEYNRATEFVKGMICLAKEYQWDSEANNWQKLSPKPATDYPTVSGGTFTYEGITYNKQSGTPTVTTNSSSSSGGSSVSGVPSDVYLPTDYASKTISALYITSLTYNGYNAKSALFFFGDGSYLETIKTAAPYEALEKKGTWKTISGDFTDGLVAVSRTHTWTSSNGWQTWPSSTNASITGGTLEEASRGTLSYGSYTLYTDGDNTSGTGGNGSGGSGTSETDTADWLTGTLTSGSNYIIYRFTAETSTSYKIIWQDANNSNDYTGHVEVTCGKTADGIDQSANYYWACHTNTAWSTGDSVTPDGAGYVYIKVFTQNYDSKYAGTFRICVRRKTDYGDGAMMPLTVYGTYNDGGSSSGSGSETTTPTLPAEFASKTVAAYYQTGYTNTNGYAVGATPYAYRLYAFEDGAYYLAKVNYEIVGTITNYVEKSLESYSKGTYVLKSTSFSSSFNLAVTQTHLWNAGSWSASSAATEYLGGVVPTLTVASSSQVFSYVTDSGTGAYNPSSSGSSSGGTTPSGTVNATTATLSTASLRGTYNLLDWGSSSSSGTINFSTNTMTVIDSEDGTSDSATFTYTASSGLLITTILGSNYSAYIKKMSDGTIAFLLPYTRTSGSGLYATFTGTADEGETLTITFNSDGTFVENGASSSYYTCTWTNNNGIIEAVTTFTSDNDTLYTTYYLYDGTMLYELIGTLVK